MLKKYMLEPHMIGTQYTSGAWEYEIVPCNWEGTDAEAITWSESFAARLGVPVRGIVYQSGMIESR